METLQTQPEVPTKKRFGPLELLLVALLGLVIGVAVTFLLTRNQVQTTQPKTFASYDDCAANGGTLTRDGDISACIGGDKDLFLQFSAQNLPRLQERKITTTPNIVEQTVMATPDLVTFLSSQESGCATTGYFKVIKEVPGRFALMNYGCDEADNTTNSAHIVAIKLADGWSLISPTNHMSDDGVPSCLMSDVFKISQQLSDKCFENTGYGNGEIRTRNYE